MPSISWTLPARDDLRALDRWLEQNCTPEFALSTIATIRSRAAFLENFPRGGRPHRNGIRILRVLGTPYLLQYRIVGGVVQVLRVHHERENWSVQR